MSHSQMCSLALLALLSILQALLHVRITHSQMRARLILQVTLRYIARIVRAEKKGGIFGSVLFGMIAALDARTGPC
jgi:hypothetical protein